MVRSITSGASRVEYVKKENKYTKCGLKVVVNQSTLAVCTFTSHSLGPLGVTIVDSIVDGVVG